MPSLFSALNVALRALLSHQQALQVTEHNVANANTPGYRRQEAVLTPGIPYSPPGFNRSTMVGQMGTGVQVDHIRRFNIDFFDGRYRSEVAESVRWDIGHQILSQVEATLAETTSDGLTSKLDAFWTGWQNLSSDPANRSLRADLLQRAKSLTDGINRRALDLRKLRHDQNLSLIQHVDEINNIADQIARLNTEISSVQSVGDQPNDLLDQRDLQLDRLAELTGASAYAQENGDVMVSIGGHTLVVGNTTFELSTSPDSGNDNLAAIAWEDGQAFYAPSGVIAGILTARDDVILGRMTSLDDLASAVISRINAIHTSGYGLNNATALAFFTGSDALSIRVNSTLEDVENIAAASGLDSPGDGSISNQIAGVRDELIMEGGTATINQYYTEEVAKFALEVHQAATYASNRGLVAFSLNQQRESVVGVSLDEEAAKLIQSQRAFEAAARLLTTIDEMLDRVINGMGRVGL